MYDVNKIYSDTILFRHRYDLIRRIG